MRARSDNRKGCWESISFGFRQSTEYVDIFSLRGREFFRPCGEFIDRSSELLILTSSAARAAAGPE
jgi:hypothetical protein